MEKSTSEQLNHCEIDNSLKLLRLEYGGIKDTIQYYTSDGIVRNYLSQLQEAIDKRDITAIKYCLSGLEVWYQKNFATMQSSAYCYNKEAQKDIKVKVEEFCSVFANFDDEISNLETTKNAAASQSPIIFISHKSDDKQYGDALEKFITGLGVKNDQLIYTSHPLHKIPLDVNIYDYLRENINSQVFMIILWSDRYLESPACLNEMGAAWVAQSDYTNIYVPTFHFGNPKYRECAVDTRKMGAILNGDAHCKANMIELKNKIQTLFDLTDDEQISSYLLDKFQTEITEASANGQT